MLWIDQEVQPSPFTHRLHHWRILCTFGMNIVNMQWSRTSDRFLIFNYLHFWDTQCTLRHNTSGRMCVGRKKWVDLSNGLIPDPWQLHLSSNVMKTSHYMDAETSVKCPWSSRTGSKMTICLVLDECRCQFIQMGCVHVVVQMCEQMTDQWKLYGNYTDRWQPRDSGSVDAWQS